ncbi:MAG: arylsulfotransferase family protein [Acidimicrobiales bacterium]
MSVSTAFSAGVICDTSYREVRRVRAGKGLRADLHELRLTSAGTALVTAYLETPADLSTVGGPKNGKILESVVQEVDIDSGRVVFEWRPSAHVALSESYLGISGGAYDFFHANSIDIGADGTLLISGRHTWALYNVERTSGEVIWRLGGKRSDFKMGPGTRFQWQHDARWLPDGSITVFDNADGPTEQAQNSRGLSIALDLPTRTATLTEAYVHPDRLAKAMGSVQVLPDGGGFVGWGTANGFSAYAPDGGAIRYDARFPPGGYSYRCLRQDWSATPQGRPSVATATVAGVPSLFASWNGATALAAWRLSAGPTPGRLTAVRTVPSGGFETAIPLGSTQGYVGVDALDTAGSVIGSSPVTRVRG